MDEGHPLAGERSVGNQKPQHQLPLWYLEHESWCTVGFQQMARKQIVMRSFATCPALYLCQKLHIWTIPTRSLFFQELNYPVQANWTDPCLTSGGPADVLQRANLLSLSPAWKGKYHCHNFCFVPSDWFQSKQLSQTLPQGFSSVPWVRPRTAAVCEGIPRILQTGWLPFWHAQWEVYHCERIPLQLLACRQNSPAKIVERWLCPLEFRSFSQKMSWVLQCDRLTLVMLQEIWSLSDKPDCGRTAHMNRQQF